MSVYSLIMPKRYNLDTTESGIKIVDMIDSYKTYEGVITRCIGYSNEVNLKEVLNVEKFEEFKKQLKSDNKIKMFLIDYALKGKDINVIKMVFNLFDIAYEDEYSSLISDGKLIYKNNCLINTKDFDYIIDNFEELTGEAPLVYDECVDVLEKYMDEKLSEVQKEELKMMISQVQERMYSMRQEMAEMDDRMYEEWYNWRTDANYHSYDSYPLDEQVEIWEYFKNYYSSIELESESEMEEEDYDY